MNKTIALVGIALVVLGIAFFFITMQKAPQEAAVVQNTTPNASEGTLKSLMAMQGAQRCDIHNTADTSASHGTVYVANGSMRGDFVTSTPTNSTEIESHMIIADNTMYAWGSAMPQGVKMSLDKVQAMQNASSSNAQVNLDQKMQYSCLPWEEDATMFAVPTSVEFMDVSAMMPAGTGTAGATGAGNPTSKANQCAMCDSLPAAQKAQCRAALQCK